MSEAAKAAHAKGLAMEPCRRRLWASFAGVVLAASCGSDSGTGDAPKLQTESSTTTVAQSATVTTLGATTTTTRAAAPTTAVTTSTTRAPATTAVYYDNCAAVRAAGKSPLRRGDPGYRTGLDGDGDGIACE